MLKSKTIDQVSRKVYQKYPDIKGSKPKVKKRSGAGGDQGYVLIYEAKVEGPGGKTINRVVRAVTDEDGSISKLSTSK
jgi:hypothetical protein